MKSFSLLQLNKASRGARRAPGWSLLILLLLAGISLRVYLLFKYPDLWFCSDEANLGLMALDLLREGQFRIFIAGESYGGSLGVATSAFFTLLTGSPFLGMKLTPLLFFCLFALTLYFLGREVFGKSTAMVAVALISLSPSFLTHLGIRERGPHAETLFLGTLLMYLTLRLTRVGAHGVRPVLWFAWGTLAGFSWYTHYLSIVFIVPCAIFLALTQRPFASLRLSGFFAGSILYWIYALQHHVLPPFGTTGTNYFNPLGGLANFSIVGFPVLTGARWSFHRDDLLPIFSKLIVLFYVGAVLTFLLAFMWKRLEPARGKVLIALHLILNPLIFIFSNFAWFADEPRYLIGLYASLPLVVAWFITTLWRHSKLIASFSILLLTSVSVYGSITIPPEVFNTIYAEPNNQLLAFLREKKVTHFYANYWIVYRLMFESEKQLVGANYFANTKERYPEYKRQVDQHPTPAYIAWHTEAPPFEDTLKQSNRTYSRQVIGRYIIFYNLHPRL